MKKYVYYFIFLVFCLGLSFLIHAGLEIMTLKIITNNLSVYESSFVWTNWFLVHKIASFGLTTLAIITSVVFAPRCWQVLYIDKKYGAPWL